MSTFEQYVSVIAGSWVLALEPHLRFLLEEREWGSNEAQVSPPENAHSAAAVVLTTFLLESVVRRAAYMLAEWPFLPRRERTRWSRPERDVPRLVGRLCGHGVAADVREAFIVRDILAHNHLWTIEFLNDPEHDFRLARAELSPGFGDRKYRLAVDQRLRVTRRLGLHAIPTRIDRHCAAIVLSVTTAALREIECRPGAAVSMAGATLWIGKGLEHLYDAAARFALAVGVGEDSQADRQDTSRGSL